MSELNLINEDKFIKIDNDLWLNAESIGISLGYSEPKKAVLKIYERNQKELNHFSCIVKMTAPDGKAYNTRVFNEEGIYLITMHANTSKASQFRIELAKFVKQKRLEALQDAKETAFKAAVRINNRYRNLRLTNSEIKRLHILLNAGVLKRDIAKLLRISVDSIRRIEKDLISAGEKIYGINIWNRKIY